MEELEKYWEAVQYRVCAKCVDSDGHSNCRLSGEEECGIKLHFPKIVETILSVQSEKLDAYVEALRNNVCATCKHQSPDGTCMVRRHLDCGLDRYFPMIVEVVEDVRLELENTSQGFGD